jgi:hypothetical protein
MKRSIVAAAAAVLFAASPATAQTAPVLVHTFSAVDAVEVDAAILRITGVLVGEAAPVTRQFPLPTSAGYSEQYVATCHRFALLVMTKPGAYRFEVNYEYPGAFPNCKLLRVAP